MSQAHVACMPARHARQENVPCQDSNADFCCCGFPAEHHRLLAGLQVTLEHLNMSAKLRSKLNPAPAATVVGKIAARIVLLAKTEDAAAQQAQVGD